MSRHFFVTLKGALFATGIRRKKSLQKQMPVAQRVKLESDSVPSLPPE
jgi:hypothetical protein